MSFKHSWITKSDIFGPKMALFWVIFDPLFSGVAHLGPGRTGPATRPLEVGHRDAQMYPIFGVLATPSRLAPNPQKGVKKGVF